MQVLPRWLAHGLPFDGTSVYGQISQVGQQLLRTVLGLDELEKFWRVINELGGGSLTDVPVWIWRVSLTVVQVFPPIKTS